MELTKEFHDEITQKEGVVINKEKFFHNKRIAFYVDDDMTVRYIPRGFSHAEYFDSIKKPEYINFICRGYILGDHAMLYKGNDFSIPKDMSIQYVLDIFSMINIEHPIKWMGLGCIIGETGEEWKPKIVISVGYINEI